MPVLAKDKQQRLDEISQELDRRKREALACYRPLPPPSEQSPFHEDVARQLVLRGGNRSGKSVAVACEFGSRVLGIPLKDSNGNDIPLRWPVSKPDDIKTYWLIGWDIKHIGQTIYRLLFKPGLFRVIKDQHTGEWRTWMPQDSWDAAHKHLSKPAEPVIPSRLIKPDSWSWENKAAHIFESVEMTNGALICAFPSSAKAPKQGDAVDGIYVDEDIQFYHHMREWQMRTIDNRGWLLWAVWPHRKNWALTEMLDRAEAQKEDPKPQIKQFQLITSQNKFFSKEDVSEMQDWMVDEDELKRRDRGDMLLDALNMYDFAKDVHLLNRRHAHEFRKKPENKRDLLELLLTLNGRLPREWTRYLSIDPSHTRTAIHSGVVPPDEWEGVKLGHTLIIEWELVLRKASAVVCANEIRKKIQGLNYEAFIMDQMIGRQTSAGQDKTVFQTYSDQFEKHGLLSRQTHAGFVPGLNIPTSRYRTVRSMLDLQGDSEPIIYFVADKTFYTQKEFHSYRKKQKVEGAEEIILDEPANPRSHDCMASMEYLCSYVYPLMMNFAAYVEPQAYGTGGSPAYRRAISLLRSQKAQHEEGSYVHLGPGATAAL